MFSLGRYYWDIEDVLGLLHARDERVNPFDADTAFVQVTKTKTKLLSI